MSTTPSEPTTPAPPPTDKSVGAALALTFFFGPFGLFYTTVAGAFIMIAVGVLVGIVTLGFGLALVWPATMIWGAVSAGNQHQAFETWKVHRLAGGGVPDSL